MIKSIINSFESALYGKTFKYQMVLQFMSIVVGAL
jgi:hypothetical protein